MDGPRRESGEGRSARDDAAEAEDRIFDFEEEELDTSDTNPDVNLERQRLSAGTRKRLAAGAIALSIMAGGAGGYGASRLMERNRTATEDNVGGDDDDANSAAEKVKAKLNEALSAETGTETESGATETETAVEKSAEQDIVAQFLDAEFREGAEDVENGLTGDFKSYDVEGGYHDIDKTRDNSEAYMKDVLYNLFGITKESEATDLQLRQALYFVDTHQAFSGAMTAVDWHLEGFEGLDYNQATDKVENMSDAEKEAFAKLLAEGYANASIERSVLTEEQGREYRNTGVIDRGDGDFDVKSIVQDGTGFTVYKVTVPFDDGNGHVTTYTSERKTPCANHGTEAQREKIVEEKEDKPERFETPEDVPVITPEPDNPQPETDPQPEPGNPQPDPEPETDPQPDPEPEPDNPQSETKTPLDQDVVDQGTDNHVVPLEQDGPVTTIDESSNVENPAPNPGETKPVTETNDNGAEVTGQEQVGVTPTNQEAIDNADDSAARERADAEARAAAEAEAAARAEQDRINAERAAADAAVAEARRQAEEAASQQVDNTPPEVTAEQQELANNFEEEFGHVDTGE